MRAMGPWVNASDVAPAPKHNEGSSQLPISGLNSTAFGLAVYASQGGSPLHHARLASGCWSQLCRAGFKPAGFQ